MKFVLLLVALVVAVVAQPTEDYDGMTLVATPYGWRPKQCVFKWPSGSKIREMDNSTEVTLPTGKVVHVPMLEECLRWDYNVPSVPSTFADRNAKAPGSRVRDGWLDNAYYWTDRGVGDSSTYVDKFSGYYTVPNTPQDEGGLLYYFLGAENLNDSGSKGVTILQPVLTYYGSWYMNSWNCCPFGQSHESAKLSGMGPGDKVFGSMYETGDLTTGDWYVLSSFNGNTVSLEVKDASRTFDWIDATLETYYVGSDCNKLASGTLTYSEMALTTQTNGETASTTIDWAGADPSACDGRTTIQSPTRVTIEHGGS